MQETHFQTLKEYINKAYEAGMNDDQITEQLTSNGWDKQDVLSAIRALSTSKVYSQPTEASSPITTEVPNTQTQNLGGSGKPPKFTVIEAIKESINAVGSNIGKVLLAGLILLVTYIAFVIVAMLILFASFAGSAGSDPFNSGILFIILILFALIFGAWYNAVFITGMSIPVKDALDGRETSFKNLLNIMFLKSWRVMFAQVGLYLIIAIPFVILVGFNVLVAIGGGSSPLLTILSYLLPLIWVVVVLLRFVLAPYIALFDPSVKLTKVYSKSYSLLKGGGQWFLVKLYLLIIASYIVYLIFAGIVGDSMRGGTSFLGEVILITIIENIVVFLIAVVVNSIYIVLYINRSKYLDPERSIGAINQNNEYLHASISSGSGASASPLSKQQ